MHLLRRFVSVGVVNTLMGLAVIRLALLAGWNDYAANAAGYLAGFACSYLLHRSYTFAAKQGAHARQLPRFAAAAALAYGLNFAVIHTGQRLGLGGSMMLQVTAVGTYTAAFFLLSRRFVFREGDA